MFVRQFLFTTLAGFLLCQISLICASVAHAEPETCLTATDNQHRIGALDMPDELWQLVGEYLTPDDIARLSAVCSTLRRALNAGSLSAEKRAEQIEFALNLLMQRYGNFDRTEPERPHYLGFLAGFSVWSIGTLMFANVLLFYTDRCIYQYCVHGVPALIYFAVLFLVSLRIEDICAIKVYEMRKQHRIEEEQRYKQRLAQSVALTKAYIKNVFQADVCLLKETQRAERWQSIKTGLPQSYISIEELDLLWAEACALF